MTEEEKKALEAQQANQGADGLDKDYIAIIEKMKKDTVSKDDYDKLLGESRKLVEALSKSKPAEDNGDKVINKPTAAELRKDLFNNPHNNLEYCKLALDLRDAVLEEEGKDIFVANNSVYSAPQESYAAAERVADVMKQCIDKADGDSEYFTNELMRRTNDVPIPKK